MRPIVAITAGDQNGIGPEVVLKSLLDRRVRRAVIPLLVGPAGVFAWYAERLALPFRPKIVDPDPEVIRRAWRSGFAPLVALRPVGKSTVRPGVLSAAAGRAAAEGLAAAVKLAMRGVASAVVTAPVSKKAMHRGGIRTPGQTELVRRLTGGTHVAMMLVSPTLRVGLVTIHIPLAKVARTLTPALVRERILTIHRALRDDWGINRPTVAVLGLNPHAGEGGDLGREEQRVLRPVLRSLRARGMRLDGPFPADAFFARYRPGTYDGVVAMYHDQGLIPLKMTAKGRGVNVSVGLPVVRTSPDHGTAFDIAGKGEADASSMAEAVLLAVTVFRNRSRRRRVHP